VRRVASHTSGLQHCVAPKASRSNGQIIDEQALTPASIEDKADRLSCRPFARLLPLLIQRQLNRKKRPCANYIGKENRTRRAR